MFSHLSAAIGTLVVVLLLPLFLAMDEGEFNNGGSGGGSGGLEAAVAAAVEDRDGIQW
jgi:hypothetical protein